MKYRLLIIILTLISCKKVSDKSIELKVNENGIEIHEFKCPLVDLKKTTDYKNELKQYDKLNKDTIIEIERKKVGIRNYRTILENREFEQILWLLTENDEKTDTLLIKYDEFVEHLFTVESEFDNVKCQIRIIQKEFSMNGDLLNTEIKKIKL